MPINSVDGISQKRSIVKSSGKGSLKSTLARRCPTLKDGNRFLDADLPEVERSKHAKKYPNLKTKFKDQAASVVSGIVFCVLLSIHSCSLEPITNNFLCNDLIVLSFHALFSYSFMQVTK